MCFQPHFEDAIGIASRYNSGVSGSVISTVMHLMYVR